MALLFRLACPLAAYPSGKVRPEKPVWLREGNRINATQNQANSFNYWTKIYWATPPWMNAKYIAAMKRIYTQAPRGHHVDHIVPLSSATVCGLHVPWNLQYLPEKVNLSKSNSYWPGCPWEILDAFPLVPEPYQMALKF